jgi:hypothetical protein
VEKEVIYCVGHYRLIVEARLMKIMLTILVVLLVLTAKSYAESWIIVPGTKGDDLICLDRDNVTKEKGIFSAWIKRIKEGGNYTKTLIEVDCSKKKTRKIKSIEYEYATDTTTMVDHKPVWEVCDPGTPESAATVMICKKGKGFIRR